MAALNEAATVCRKLSLSRHFVERLTPQRVLMKCANDILALSECPSFIDKIVTARAETPDRTPENSDEEIVKALFALNQEGKIDKQELYATLDMENGRLRTVAAQLKTKNSNSESA